jgi:diacylglycerol kinase family enzyme
MVAIEDESVGPDGGGDRPGPADTQPTGAVVGRGWVVVANAAAGSTDRASLDQVMDVLRRHGDAELRWTDGPADLDTVIDDTAEQTLVVAGGDGSISLVAGRLMARGLGARPIALIPLGTGNDLARAVGLPLDPQGAALVAAEGEARPMDALAVTGRYAINAVHVGVGAAAARRAAGLKRYLRRAAYPAGALLAGLSSGGWPATVHVDGETPVVDHILMVAVMNGSSIGGGTELAPGREPDDGRAAVVTAMADGLRARAGFGLDLIRGRHLARTDVDHRRGTRVEIAAPRPLPVNADGEDLGNHSHLVVEVVRRSWSLVAPVAPA